MTDDKSTRQQSTIQFPYRDLESSVTVAEAIWRAGMVDGIASDQLAVRLDINVGTGNFMTRIAAAKMFGLLSTVGGRYKLTDLGYAILDKNERKQKEARVAAFMNVPLYKKAVDAFRGKPLPPRPAGLEQTFIDWGVAPKQKDNARLAFEKSARFAGFFDAGEGRLVPPVISPPRAEVRLDLDPPPPSPPPPAPPPADDTHTPLPLLIRGLVEAIPKSPLVTWPLEDRVEWLRLAVSSFNVMFKIEGDITITGTPKKSLAPVERPAPAATSPAPAGGGGRPTARGSKAELDDDIPF
jgi:hypothetical protein